jgi:hypothetical protein
MLMLARIVLRLIEDALRWLMLLARSDESVRAENLVLRRQLAMFIERGIRPPSNGCRYPSQLGGADATIRLAQRAGGRAAGYDRSLASRRLETLLANEVSARSTANRSRTPGADPADGRGQSSLG